MERGRPDNPLEYAPTGQAYQGSAIRQLRQAKKLGLRQLAALIPYHYGALSNVENNRAPVSSETLQRIAELLGVDAEELARLPVHPRLAQQQAGALEQPPTGDQTRALEELKADMQELKAEVADVKAVGKNLHSVLREIVRLVDIRSTGFSGLRKRVALFRFQQSQGAPPAGNARATVRPSELEVGIEEALQIAEMNPEVSMHWREKSGLIGEWKRLAAAWDEQVTELEGQPGELRVVMRGLHSVTLPPEQYVEQVRPILEREREELSKEARDAAAFIRQALVHRELRQAAFEERVQEHLFRHIMPIGALDWYKQNGFHRPDDWAHLMGGKPATAEQQMQHIRSVIRLLDTYPNYHLGLLMGNAGESDLYKMYFWVIKADHTLLVEDFNEGETDYISKDREEVGKLCRYFECLWKSEDVVTDKKDVKWLLEKYITSPEKLSLIS